MYIYIQLFSQSVMSDSLQPHGLYSAPGSSVHGILQARILEWVAISFSHIYIYIYIYLNIRVCQTFKLYMTFIH